MCTLLIGGNNKISTFKHEQEMMERREGSQKLMVEEGVFLLGVGELLEYKANGAQEPSRSCCRTAPRFLSDASIHGERDGSIRSWMNKFWKGGEKILGSGEGGVHNRGPGEGLPRTLESVSDRGRHSGCTPEKLPVEEVPKELDLGHCKLAFGQPDG